jgi:hypothetical protein
MEENAPYFVAVTLVIPELPLPAGMKLEAWHKYSPILAANLLNNEWFAVTQSAYV